MKGVGVIGSVERGFRSPQPLDAGAALLAFDAALARRRGGLGCPPFERRYVKHHPYPLNVDEIIRLAPLLDGEHDFTAFAATDERDELGASKVRTIFCSRLTAEGARLIYRVTGSGFLKHMVRNIVGVLLEVGKGNVDRAGLVARLEPRCGIPPGPTAPARGLFLVSVKY